MTLVYLACAAGGAAGLFFFGRAMDGVARTGRQLAFDVIVGAVLGVAFAGVSAAGVWMGIGMAVLMVVYGWALLGAKDSADVS